MTSFSRITGWMGGVILAGIAVVWTPTQSLADVAILRVPCDPVALAAKITDANNIGKAILSLRLGCTYNITTPATAATALPIITGDLTLLGTYVTIRRDPDAAPFRIFEVATSGTLRVTGLLKKLSIVGGDTVDEDVGNDDCTVADGGGILNEGTLVLKHVTLTNNKARDGGGAYNCPGAVARIYKSVFTSNTTRFIGGGGILNHGELTVKHSVFTENTAPLNGGGINTQANGTTSVLYSLVKKNTSNAQGGGISNLGITKLAFTSVILNKGSAGGGIATSNAFNPLAKVFIKLSKIRKNIPDNCYPLNTIPGCVD